MCILYFTLTINFYEYYVGKQCEVITELLVSLIIIAHIAFFVDEKTLWFIVKNILAWFRVP